MGQVPEKNTPYVLVGDGRMARHLAAYFRYKDIPFLWWSRRAGIIQSLDSLDSVSKKPHSPAPLCEIIPAQAKVLLLVKDDAIESVFDEGELARSGRIAIHFSGAHTSVRIIGFHPLCTFGPEIYSFPFYESIPFVGEAGVPTFPEIFPELNNPFFTIRRDQKAYYHALCTVAGNFSQILWQTVFERFESDLNLPKETLIPFMKKTFENLLEHPDRALTGPFARGDTSTIDRHLQALAGHPLASLYEEFYRFYSSKTARVERKPHENSFGIPRS